MPRTGYEWGVKKEEHHEYHNRKNSGSCEEAV